MKLKVISQQIRAGRLRVPPRPTRRHSGLNDSQSETLRRFRNGESVNEISRTRGFVGSTIYGHLVAAIERGEPLAPNRFFTAGQQEEIAAAFRQTTNKNLGDVNALLAGKYDIGQLRVFRALATHA